MMKKPFLRWILLALPVCSGVLACAGSTPAGTSAAPSADEVSVSPGSNERFLDPTLDVDRFVEMFEGESREIAVHRDDIAATLELTPGMSMVDVGAGTGLFLAPLAAAVAPGGRVYAVDISPGFIERLHERVASEGLAGVEVCLGGERTVDLPAASVDVALICDTYHHFEYPVSMLASIKEALRPDGLLVVVDFERIPGVSREWVLGHLRADKATFRGEIEAAGFLFEDEVELDGLEENYVLRFRRP